jgi:hypothetical protein
VALQPSDGFNTPFEVKGEEEYVVTLAQMMLLIKQQLDRMELRVEIIVENTAPSKLIRPGLED